VRATIATNKNKITQLSLLCKQKLKKDSLKNYLTNDHIGVRLSLMKTYKTYQARNAVKAAEVTNHIKARKKEGVTHEQAKAEAYRIYKIKAALPILSFSFKEVRTLATLADAKEGLERAMNSNLPPLPTID
jgi:hypothetical protein